MFGLFYIRKNDEEVHQIKENENSYLKWLSYRYSLII